MRRLAKMQTPTDIFRIEYPEIEEFTREQLKVFWTADEIKVEKDIQDIKTNLTTAEQHGVFTTLKLFTLYEMKAGSDYWTDRFMKMFPRHEFAGMSATFGMFELAVHKPFYNKINELLHATDDSFYTEYKHNPILSARMKSIDEVVDKTDPFVSLACFSIVEGAILYSSFAFLKHFQSLGKNKLMNVVRGINFSVRDENIHALAGAWCFNKLKHELNRGGIADDGWVRLMEEIYTFALNVAEHEKEIINMIFEDGDIEGITKEDMHHFVQNRIDFCLGNLGLDYLFNAPHSKINDWFYKGINNYQFNDFFTGAGREYTRDWNEKGFVW